MKLALLALLALYLFSCCTVSRPAHNNKPYESSILLDFNGYKANEPSWDSLTEFEAAGLDSMFQYRVLEEVRKIFSMFNVLVTTDEATFRTYPLWKRSHAVITKTTVYEGDILPVVGIATFNRVFLGDTTFAYIHSGGYNKSVKGIAQVIAHEVGHNLGLAHQATWINGRMWEAYSTGNQEEAPLMGYPGYSDTAVWADGINSIGQFQSDTAILFSVLGRR